MPTQTRFRSILKDKLGGLAECIQTADKNHLVEVIDTSLKDKLEALVAKNKHDYEDITRKRCEIEELEEKLHVAKNTIRLLKIKTSLR